MDGGVREAVVVKKAHLLVEQAVNHMSSGVLPPHQADQVPVQCCAQVHGPVIAVQSHLHKQAFRSGFRSRKRAAPHHANLQEHANQRCLQLRKKMSIYVSSTFWAQKVRSETNYCCQLTFFSWMLMKTNL